MVQTPFCASIECSIVSAETAPAVEAKYERVHKDGSFFVFFMVTVIHDFRQNDKRQELKLARKPPNLIG